jgi:hypothetical protein
LARPQVNEARVRMSEQPDFPVPTTEVEQSKHRRAPEPQPIDPEKLPTLPYYERHPEHCPRPLSPRLQRRLRIRGAL